MSLLVLVVCKPDRFRSTSETFVAGNGRCTGCQGGSGTGSGDRALGMRYLDLNVRRLIDFG